VNRKKTVGIIGCGLIAGRFQRKTDKRTYSHAKAIFENGNYNGIGFYDIHTERSIHLAEEYGGRSYRSLRALLEEMNPRILVICSPDEKHFSQLVEVFNSNYIPEIIFVEKPLCTSRKELRILGEITADHPLSSVFINHSRRFDHLHIKVAETVSGGKFGSFRHGRIDYYGGWRHNGIHLVDYLTMCLGYEMEITGAEYACESKYPGDETLHVNAGLYDAKISFRGHDEADYQIMEMDMFFENGRVLITDFGMQVDCYVKGVNEEKENVLYRDSSLSGRAMSETIKVAYSEINSFLDNHISVILDSVSVNEVSKVMENIWNAREHYEQR